MKQYAAIAIIIGVLAVLALTYWLGYSHSKPPVIEQTTNATYVQADSIPARVSIIHVPAPTGEVVPSEYASMDTTLVSPSGLSNVKLGVGYNEYANTFDLRSVFTETTQTPVIRKRLITPIASIGVGFADSLKLHDAEISAGVEFMERYSLSLFGRTDKTYGLRFGVRF